LLYLYRGGNLILGVGIGHGLHHHRRSASNGDRTNPHTNTLTALPSGIILGHNYGR
jgi:hypothetical protein